MKILKIIFVLLACSLSAFGSTPSFKAVRVDSPPLIDGKLTDACWNKAEPVREFKIMNSKEKVQYETTAFVLYNNNGLYFGIKCFRKNMATMPAQKRDRDKQVYHDECVEIMLDPNQDKKTYYHFAVNAVGSIFDRVCDQGGFVGDAKWDGEIKSAAYQGSDFWSCEIFVPFYTLEITPQVGPTWRFNIGREAKNPNELSAISSDGSFNIAGMFAELTGIDVDFAKYCWKLDDPVSTTNVKDGRLELKLNSEVQNNTGSKSTVNAESMLLSPADQVYMSSSKIDIDSKTPQNLLMGTFSLTEKGKYKYYISLTDPVTKVPLTRKSGYIDVSYIPMAIDLAVPWYKDAVFATQKIKNIVCSINLNMSAAELENLGLEVCVRSKGSDTPLETKLIEKAAVKNEITFDAQKLPDGKFEILAKLIDKNGKVKTETIQAFRKLPYRKGEVWLGRDMQWYVDGKKFFMLGGWNRGEDFISDYNTFVEARPGTKLLSCAFLCQTPSHLRGGYKQKKLPKDLVNYIVERVKKERENPDLLAYYASDEPEVFGTTEGALSEVYKLITETDPYHPVVISNDTLSGLKDYADCADINGLHPYPTVLQGKEMNSFDEIVFFVESAVKFFNSRKHKQTIAYLHQGFNYGDYGAVNSRVPSYEEYRNQNFLALICGAKGILQYNRSVAHYPELYIGMPALTEELKYVSNILLADDGKGKALPDSMKLMVKKTADDIWVFACNASHTPVEAKLTVPGLNGRILHVFSEARTINVSGDSFTDKFGNYQVHIYTTNSRKSGLRTVKAICEAIDKVNNARRKPGNLAFQMFENNGVKVTASSNRGRNRRDDNGLWHVVDGIFGKIDHYHTLSWMDATPGQSPDWIEIKLPRPEKVSKVIVYPLQKSLKDYEVQAWLDGSWKTVDKVSGRNDDVINHEFSPVKTDRIRLFITGTNGPNAQITEIEVY